MLSPLAPRQRERGDVGRNLNSFCLMTTLTLYDRRDCPYSKLVRSTLDRLGVDYDETLVPDEHENRTEVEERPGQTGVPVLFDDRVENGFVTDSTDIVQHLEDTDWGPARTNESRRRVLAALGTSLAAGLAGCSGDNRGADEGADASGGDEADDGDSGSGDDTGDSEDEGTPTGSNVVLVEDSESTREYANSSVQAIDFVVENQGGSRSGGVSVRVDWTNADGDVIAEGDAGVFTLGSGVRWSGLAAMREEPDEEPDDYEVSVSAADELDEQPDLSVTESSIEIAESDGEEELVVRGTATNNTGEDWDSVVINVQLLDGQGTLVAEEIESDTSIDDGETWDFERPFSDQDTSLAEDGEAEFYFEVQHL